MEAGLKNLTLNIVMSFSVLLNEKTDLECICVVPVDGNLQKRCETGREIVRKSFDVAEVLVCLFCVDYVASATF